MPYNPFIMRHLSIYFMLLACFHFATLGALSKILSEQMTSVEIVFFRNLIGLIIILIALNKDRNFGHGGKPVLLIFRGVIGSVGLLLFFYNVAHIDLGTQGVGAIWKLSCAHSAEQIKVLFHRAVTIRALFTGNGQ